MDETIRQRIEGAYALFNERREIDPGVFDADVVWHNAPEFPGASVHHGRDAVMRDIQRQQEAWGEASYRPTAILAAGGDRYVVLLDVQVKGAASGATASLEGAHLLTFRDGKAVEVQAFLTHEQALAAAGLGRGL